MATAFSWIGILFSALSVVMLITHGVELGVAAPLKLILEFYGSALQSLLGWTDPYLNRKAAVLGASMGVDLSVGPNWKHVFIPMIIFFGAWVREFSDRKYYLDAAIFSLLGLVTAVLVSIAVGSQSPSALVNVIPVAAIAIFLTIRGAWVATLRRAPEKTWLQYFTENYGTQVAFITIVCLGLAMLLAPHIERVEKIIILGDSSLILIFSIFGLSLSFIMIGALHAMRFRKEGINWWNRFRGLGVTRVGTSILTVIGAVFIFLLANAGLKLVGI